jgi:uncharacterized repeat protein (TIGR02543 family)
MAAANNTFVFTNWTTTNGTVLSTSSNYTFTVSSNETLVANFLPACTLAVSAFPANDGTVSGGGTFPAGNANTVMAAANNTFVFINWTTTNGTVLSTSSNYTFTVSSNETLVANFLPTCTLAVSAFPANDGTVSGGGTFPAGSTNTVMATANTGFEFIGWTGDATGMSNPLTVTVNTNLNITAYFAAIGSMTLTIITRGDGTVSPNLNARNLKAGKGYTLRAIAKSGNVFSNWTGSITTNKNLLTVKMQFSMVLQANFIPNPFLPVKGTYNGLFITTNGVTEQTAGMLRGLIVSQRGTYSGTLLFNGGNHAISGAFNLSGQATNHILRPASQGGPLVAEMTLNWNDSPPQVTGTVSGTTWVANLIADPATSGLPAAEYTMLIPPDTNNAPPDSSPGGDGYALIAQNLSTTRITGALADGTAFSQSMPVSQTGYVPIYVNLYGSKGLLLGWINLTNASGMSLAWVHPTVRSGLFPGAFTSTNQIALSPWTNPPANSALPTNLVVVETTNNTPVQTNNFTITITNGTLDFGKLSGPATPLNGSIAPKTGLLKVTFGSGASKTTGYGVTLLNGTNGGGYFLTKTNAGAVILEP